MLPKKLLFIPIFLVLSYATLAQDEGRFKVEGQVLGADNNEPLARATVTLLNPQDSGLVVGKATNANGKFIIRARKGDYILKVNYVSYQAEIIPDIELGPQEKNLSISAINLKRANKNLEEVLVEGERSKMTLENGKKIFNVGSDLTNIGASASEVLRRIPSVEVDRDGHVTLRGMGVEILVNGKPSGLIGINGTEALRYFPANQIDRVEVITNPSAKYESAGSAGIINIILKENAEWGLNGTFNAEAGYPKKYGGSANINFRNKWYNLFANYNFNIDRRILKGYLNKDFYFPDSTAFMYKEWDWIWNGANHNFQFGSEFYFSPKDVLKVSGVLGISDQNNYYNYLYEDYTERGGIFTQKTLRNEDEVADNDNYELNFNFEKTFTSKEHILTADLQLRHNIRNLDSDRRQKGGEPGQELAINQLQESNNDTEVNANLAKVDYTMPIGEKGKFEAGFRREYRKIGNNFKVRQRQNDQVPWKTLEKFTNTFNYDEGIYAGYVQFDNEFGNFSYQGGLRYEFTGIKILWKNNNEEHAREYNNFFPSASLSYNLNQGNSLQVSYSRRLTRPTFWHLIPNRNFSGNRTLWRGTPELDPSFTDSYDLGYAINTQTSSVYAGGFYRHTKGQIQYIATVNDQGITIMKPENLQTRKVYGLESRYSTDIFDWWAFNISADFFRQITFGMARGEDLSSNSYTMNGRASSNFDVKNWFDLEISGRYIAPQKQPQKKVKARYMVNLGASKSLFNEKGNLSLSIRDVFLIGGEVKIFNGSNFYSYVYNMFNPNGQFNLSFSYKLESKY